MPSGGVPGEGLDSDRPLGPLRTLPCAGHDRGLGGGGNSPPTVLHVFLVVNVKQEAPRHINVHQGHREKMQVMDGGGGSHKHRSSLAGLRTAFGDDELTVVVKKYEEGPE